MTLTLRVVTKSIPIILHLQMMYQLAHKVWPQDVQPFKRYVLDKYSLKMQTLTSTLITAIKMLHKSISMVTIHHHTKSSEIWDRLSLLRI